MQFAAHPYYWRCPPEARLPYNVYDTITQGTSTPRRCWHGTSPLELPRARHYTKSLAVWCVPYTRPAREELKSRAFRPFMSDNEYRGRTSQGPTPWST